jgi:hypothetical protein
LPINTSKNCCGIVLAMIKTVAFPKCPDKLKERGNLSVMKILKQILLMAVVVIGFSITAMAQKDDDKNRPKKPDPPVIVAPDKDRPKDNNNNNDNNNNRPKKPQEAIFESKTQTEISSV